MLIGVVLLLPLGCALAGPAFMKYFKIEEPLSRPASRVDQRAPEYPSDDDFNATDDDFNATDDDLNATDNDFNATDDDFNATDNDFNATDDNFNATDLRRPEAGSEYMLSYADSQVTWESFKIDYNREYATEEEERQRYSIFLDNINLIETHNLKYHNGETSFYLGINRFTDLTNEEYRSRLGIGRGQPRPNSTTCIEYIPENNTVSSSVDWRNYGYVSSVKDQFDCGSCYAFSAAAAIEGQWFRHSGNLYNLSAQQILDCSGKYYNDGCGGGYMDLAFQYVIDAGGIQTAESYPYRDTDNCTFNVKEVVANISSCSIVLPANNETALQVAVSNIGPISVYIDANGEMFQNYAGGIFDNITCTLDTDHGVLVVGYGSEACQDYWIVKNSYGVDWGEKGYIRMSRNRDDQCGIATQAFFPNI